MAFNGFERSVYRTIAVGLAMHLFAMHGEDHLGLGPLTGFAVLSQRHKTIGIVTLVGGLFADQGQNVFVENITLAISELFEAGKGGIDIGLGLHLHTQVQQALLEGVAPTELAQDQFVGAPAHILGAHDLVSVTCFEHAVLMDTGGVRKGIGSHHSFVGLHHKARGLAHHAAGGQDVSGIDAAIQAKVVAPGFDGHHHLFQRAIARPLTQSIDGALDLARATDLDTRQGVGHRHAQIVVAVHRPNGFVAVGDALAQSANEFAIQLRNGIAHRVRHIDGGGAFLDDGFDHTAQKVHIAAVAIFRAEFNVIEQVAGKTHRLTGLLKHLVGRHAQLFLHVQGRGGNEGMDAAPFRTFEGLGRSRNISVVGSGQRTHGGVFDRIGNRVHRIKIAVGAGRKTGLDHIHLEALQLTGDAQLFVFGHRGPRGLLAVAQGGVKNDQLVAHVTSPIQENHSQKNKRPVALAYGPWMECARATHSARWREVAVASKVCSWSTAYHRLCISCASLFRRAHRWMC